MIALTETQRDRLQEIISDNTIIQVVDYKGNIIWSCNEVNDSKYTAEFGNINIDRIINEIFIMLGE